MKQKGDLHRTVVKILKVKKGVPTSIEMAGRKYALVPETYVNGEKKVSGIKPSKKRMHGIKPPPTAPRPPAPSPTTFNGLSTNRVD